MVEYEYKEFKVLALEISYNEKLEIYWYDIISS